MSLLHHTKKSLGHLKVRWVQLPSKTDHGFYEKLKIGMNCQTFITKRPVLEAEIPCRSEKLTGVAVFHSSYYHINLKEIYIYIYVRCVF